MKETLIKLFNEFFVNLVFRIVGIIIVVVFIGLAILGSIPVFLVKNYSNNWLYLLLILTLPFSVMIMTKFGNFLTNKIKQQ